MSNDPEDKGFEQSIGKQSADRGEKETARFEGEDQHGFSPDVGKGKVAKEGGDKAFEANETQDASKSEGGAIYAPERVPSTSERASAPEARSRDSRRMSPVSWKMRGRTRQEDREPRPHPASPQG